MPVPFPTQDDVDLGPVGEAETSRLAAGVLAGTRPRSGNSEFQRLLVEAIFEAMTGHRVDAASCPPWTLAPTRRTCGTATRKSGCGWCT
jgi:hypothetical protein